jgi:hypothetical protein
LEWLVLKADFDALAAEFAGAKVGLKDPKTDNPV